MKIIKQEKGSITLFVLIAMLFFTLYLVGMYVLSSNLESSQIEGDSEIKRIYEKDVNNINDVYETLLKKEKYVKTGLRVNYDFSNAKTVQNNILKDLSGNENDATINGATVVGDALQFDGDSDWVALKELNYSTVTIEAVVEYDEVPTSQEETICCNFETGGYGLSNYLVAGSTPYNKFTAYIGSNYCSAISTKQIEAHKKYSLSGSYDGTTLCLYENGEKVTATGTGALGAPHSNTIMAIGANPNGSSSNGGFFKGKIYAIRIYDRALTDAEIQTNYKMDQTKFTIE